MLYETMPARDVLTLYTITSNFKMRNPCYIKNNAKIIIPFSQFDFYHLSLFFIKKLDGKIYWSSK